MNPISDINEGVEKKLENLTSNVKKIQDNLLEEIITLNTKTEYLQRFLIERFDKKLFKKNVPIVTYEDIKPYIDRVVNGESSDVISMSDKLDMGQRQQKAQVKTEKKTSPNEPTRQAKQMRTKTAGAEKNVAGSRKTTTMLQANPFYPLQDISNG